MKKRLIRIVSVCLSLIVFITSLNLSFLVKAEGTNPSVYINPSNTQAIYTYDGYYVVFNLNGSWTGGHNVGIQIYNTGSETIEDWTLESDYSNNISNIWNASVLENANGVTKLYHDTWNSVIYPNSCVEFGFSSNETFVSFPSYFGILGSEMTETNNEMFSIEYNVTDEWEDGYTGEITITNNSENVIRNWGLDLSCNNENISVWNAKIVAHEGNRVSVGNMGFNADINPNESVSFGFIVYNKTNNDEFYDYNLYESTFVSNEPQRELEPLGDIGEIYQKELHDEDVDFDETTGLQFVKNQILISAYMGTPREAIEEIADDIGATIVGYIEITCDYQIEFIENKSLEEIQTLINYIESFPYVRATTLNTAFIVEGMEEGLNDEFYIDGKTFEEVEFYESGNPKKCYYSKLVKNAGNEDWNENAPAGDNWNLEAMHILSAWKKITNTTRIKVGIYDTYFETNRSSFNSYDDELIFDDVKNNYSNLDILKKHNKELKHGTHVAGIIGAKANNNKGVAGISQYANLYGYACSGNDFEKKYTDMMCHKIAYAELICNHVKVINVSMGYGDDGKTFVATNGTYSNSQAARDSIKYDSQIIAEFFEKLVIAGYDFLIVCSAGNANCQDYTYVNGNESIKYKYNFRTCFANESGIIHVTNIDAKYNYYLSAIDGKYDHLNQRIIVVGSRGKGKKYSSFSNVGDRVDVCAPGENIISTVPYSLDNSGHDDAVIGYEALSGTSQAAPHITGLAALMWQANPSLNAIQIKKIICDSNNCNAQDYTNDEISYSYKMPLADKCVEAAINTSAFSKNDVDWPMGMIGGSVKESDTGNLIPTTTVSAIRINTGDYNLSEYCFSFDSDNEGNFLEALPQGTYNFLFYAEGYLPEKINDVEIIPDNTNYLYVKLNKWESKNNAKVGGIIIDGTTGNVIDNAEIKVRKNWNTYTGQYCCLKNGDIISDTSSQNGIFSIKLPSGNYTLEIIKDGFLNGYYNVSSFKNSDENGYGDTFVLSPILPDDEYRIILTWADYPSDLDSHLTYYKDGIQQFHIYYANRVAYYGDEKIAQLDLDDTDGFGPETVTITLNAGLMESGEFRYSVHNFSNQKPLSESNATIRIYHGSLYPEILYVPIEASERVWYAFNITDSGISVTNEYYSVDSTSDVQ